MLIVQDSNETLLKDAFLDKQGSYSFEINKLFITKYQKCIEYYVNRLRAGATAGVRGKTDVKFRNPETDVYEYATGENENKLNYKDAEVGNLEGGEINIVSAAFLAQAYAEFLKDKINRKPGLPYKTLVGFDTRYFSKEIGEIITRVLAGNGFEVLRNIDDKPSPTPVNSLLTYVLGCAGSLNVTASHNPADQNGIKPNNEKGHLDSDDDLEIFLAFIEKLYSEGEGTGNILIAPLEENVKRIDFTEIYIKEFIDVMMDEGFLNLNLIKEAIEKGWGFVIDGIGGTGGVVMDRILSHLFVGDSWKDSILIINEEYDPNMLGIPRPDPTIPEVMEKSGLLHAMTIKHDITAGGTGDNDWDRFTAAIKIEESDIPKAKKAGLYVPKGISPPLVQFTADQMYTFFGEYQLRRTAQERYNKQIGREVDIYSDSLDEAIKSRQINLSDCYLITTYPSSILSDYLVKYYGARLIYTSVGFKNIGTTVSFELEGEINKNEAFKPIYVLGKEESGGNGFGFPQGWLKGPDGMPWLGAKDKDTSLNVLKLMETSANAYLRGKTIVDLYSDMLDRLGVITFYERVDWYTRNERNQRDDKVKSDIARKVDDLVKPEYAAKVAELLGEKLVDVAKGEMVNLTDYYLWVKIALEDVTFSDGYTINKGTPIFNRVYDEAEKKPARVKGEWIFMPVKAMKYALKSGGYFTIFHAGEGPKISLYDRNGKPVYWTLIRPSGTEIGLIRHYNEVVCDVCDQPDPLLLMKFAKPFMDYLGTSVYYDDDSYLKQFNEKSLKRVLKEKYQDT